MRPGGTPTHCWIGADPIRVFEAVYLHTCSLPLCLTSSLEPEMSLSCFKRGSGTVTMPTLGSMVQKGKLAAAALPFSTMALKRVDCSSSDAEQGAAHSRDWND
jgi:hypothetical protein